ncbi:hypothetical protein BBD32_12675 [Elizabethkingia anophelis]|uniref:Uncharacterized protein n=1 Tax=Elizabethkingia anophelis TaxID=1117645 RepID=A0AAU8VGI2_9FLAO|nr:hypothetical protein BBD32_12675 [Elizabethkingia anophelis]OPB63770.1 hypothetical protein BAY11_16845 [Elizabethkingia anophelis]
MLRASNYYCSLKNSKSLEIEGSKEFGKILSRVLFLFYVLYYTGCFIEGTIRRNNINFLGFCGVLLLCISYVLMYRARVRLGELWTLRIYIVRGYELEGFRFRHIKIWYYLLYVLLEILGIGLLSGSWLMLLYFLPVLLFIVLLRVYQEMFLMNYFLRKEKGLYGNMSLSRD